MVNQILIKILFITKHIFSYSYYPPPVIPHTNAASARLSLFYIFRFFICILGICRNTCLFKIGILGGTLDRFLLGLVSKEHKISIVPSIFFLKIASVPEILSIAAFSRADD